LHGAAAAAFSSQGEVWQDPRAVTAADAGIANLVADAAQPFGAVVALYAIIPACHAHIGRFALLEIRQVLQQKVIVRQTRVCGNKQQQ
jgi:hypothetical protein